MAKLKPSRLVELDDIISSQIIGDDPEVIALVMRIHLALDALIIEAILTFRTDDQVYILNFPAKTKVLLDQGLITAGAKAAYDRFNNFRNWFAHVFGHTVTVEELLTLARDLELCGIEFSDSVGHYSPEKASDSYGGLLGILAEIGWCLLFDASDNLRAAGGRDIAAA